MKKILKAAVLSAVGLIMMNSCIFINYPGERGNRVTASGTDTTFVFENIDATYDEIDISNNMAVHYSESVDCITVTADKNLAPYIRVYVEDGELNIDEKGVMLVNVPAAEVLVPVSSKPLKSIEVSGASRFTSSIVLENNEISISLSGASKIEVETIVKELDADISGASTLNIAGTAGEAELECSGASTLNCDDFSTDFADIHISGASKIGTLTAKKVSGNVSGASHLSVKDGCDISKVSTSGASGVSSK